jgi:hypothetical protein
VRGQQAAGSGLQQEQQCHAWASDHWKVSEQLFISKVSQRTNEEGKNQKKRQKKNRSTKKIAKSVTKLMVKSTEGTQEQQKTYVAWSGTCAWSLFAIGKGFGPSTQRKKFKKIFLKRKKKFFKSPFCFSSSSLLVRS